MQAEFINPFLQATVKVLSTMASMTPKAGKPGIREGNISKGGIIGLTGHAEGSMSVTFSESCALAVVKNMTGEDFPEMNAEVADAVGELTNMISGDARAQLQQIGYNFTAAIPTIIRGKNHTVKHISEGGPIVYIPFRPRTETSGWRLASLPHSSPSAGSKISPPATR
jgi:chemotaxis protein CheX